MGFIFRINEKNVIETALHCFSKENKNDLKCSKIFHTLDILNDEQVS